MRRSDAGPGRHGHACVLSAQVEEPRDDAAGHRRISARRAVHAGRALEVDTSVPLCPKIVRWWHEEGGATVTFGSDAHDPAGVARGFGHAAAMVEAHGFRPGRHPDDYWSRMG